MSPPTFTRTKQAATTDTEVRTVSLTTQPPGLNEAWADWLTRAHKLILDGFRLDQRTEDEQPDLDTEAGGTRVLYHQLWTDEIRRNRLGA